ncbi:MAG: RodZ domain-containing protein [Pararobbsia sp.]
MSNKQHPASEDAVAADARRLAANDAQDAHGASMTTSALPASPAGAVPTGVHAQAQDIPTSSTDRSGAASAPDVSASSRVPRLDVFSPSAVRVVPSQPPGVSPPSFAQQSAVPLAVAPDSGLNLAQEAASATASVSDTPPNSPASVGARLTRLREARRWSIEDVSTRLKVPPNKLRAIEAGDLSALPDMTFTLGVIRAYAKLLGVEAGPLTAALRESTGPIEQDLSMPASRGGGLPRGGKMSTVSWNGPPKRRPWLWAIGAVVLAVVVLLLYRSGSEPAAWLAKLKQNAETANPASAAANASAAEAAAEAPGDAPATGTDGQTPAEAGVSAPIVQAPQNTAGAMASTPAAQTLAAVAAAGSTPVAAPPARPDAASVAASGAAVVAGASAPPVPAEGQSSVHISVTQDSWVSVRQADGKEVLSGLLHAGDARDAVGTPPLQFVIGNRIGLNSLEVNGAPVDPSKYANAKGNVARFSVP